MIIPGLPGNSIDYLHKGVALPLRINSHARDHRDRMLSISTDTFEIPALKIPLCAMTPLEKRRVS
jgi:hypothetical protein